ncbi:MAG: hypothetical protein LBU09_04055 [Endomicrobium sp.]|jgi:hypothetical protein|nr:hypothetical protein [Endomicrobium sp.]
MYIPNKQNAKVLPNSPTVWKAEELNQIIQELQNIITAGGINPDAQNAAQVLQALQILFANPESVASALNAANNYTNEQIAQALSGAIHFSGYVSAAQPDGTNFKIGDKWINASSMPVTFPVSDVKKWDGSTWVADDNYTPAVFDLWSLASDQHGYYWFGGEWNLMDFNVDLSSYQLRNEKNQPNGYAGIGNNGKISSSVIPVSEISQLNGYIGEIKVIARTDTPAGLLRLDGAEYSRSAFTDFYDNYLLTSIIPTGTYTQWEAAYNNNDGNVGFVGVDNANQKFKMPRLDDRAAIMQCLTAGNIGQYGRDQIVDITASTTYIAINNNTVSNGAFETSITVAAGVQGTYGDSYPRTISFKASKVVPTGDRVQPRHIQFPLMMVAATAFLPASQAQYSGFVDGLAGKIDLPAGKNQSDIDFVIESASGLSGTEYTNGWYRKYKSGWIEQGATITKTVGANVNQTVPMIKQMYSNDYFLTVFPKGTGIDNTVDIACISKNNLNFIIRFAYSSTGGTADWEVKGMSQSD